MFNFKLLISPSFWFSTAWNPVGTRTVILMAAVFALLIVGGVVILVIAGRKQKEDAFAARFLRRLSGPCFFGGIAGGVFTFLLYEQIPILSARFWFLIIFVIFAVWLGFGIRALMINVPKLRAAATSRAAYEQYLPKRKK